MTNGGAIFTLGEAGLIKLAETAYSTESVLQEYLQKHSDLIPGDQISPENPRRWLHVAREIGVPDALDGKGRWALDHLFLDQEAIPTLIEVKRSTDTRIRREVVGQLLDYAANGRAYWTETSMREAFSSTCASLGQSDRSILRDFLAYENEADDDKIQSFWTLAAKNLAEGRVRLLFVADIIPPELQRIIEFLNEQMKNAEVLGVEVRQFSGSGTTAFVPRVVGRTMKAEDAKRSPTGGGSAGDVVPTLIRNKIIPDGAQIRFEAKMHRETVMPYFDTHPGEQLAEWQNDPNKTLIWTFDGNSYSCTGLARILFDKAGKHVDSVSGPRHWTYGGKSLVELAAQTGLHTYGLKPEGASKSLDASSGNGLSEIN